MSAQTSSHTKTPRHRAREVALQILYRYDMEQSSGKAAIPQGPALAEDIHRHFEHFKISEDLRSFAAELVLGSLKDQDLLDERIETQAANWKVSRMDPIDRSLLRMAIFEMKTFSDIPISVTLDEAIELSKEFGTSNSPSFVNGILDPISKLLRP